VDNGNGGGGGGGGLTGADGQPAEFTSKPWRPLTRKLKIPAAILSPYRYAHEFAFAYLFMFSFMLAILDLLTIHHMANVLFHDTFDLIIKMLLKSDFGEHGRKKQGNMRLPPGS
jgi:hypothetical protein